MPRVWSGAKMGEEVLVFTEELTKTCTLELPDTAEEI